MEQKRKGLFMIIGIVGKLQSGKSECSKFLCRVHNFKKISFADKLKEVVSNLWDIPLEDLYDPILKEEFDNRWGKTKREIMQLFGSEVCRVINSNTWIYHVEKQFKILGTNWVLDDVRFVNESDLIKKYNGILIRIVRPSINSDSKHISETQQDEIEIDDIIINNGNIEDLREKVDKIYYETKN